MYKIAITKQGQKDYKKIKQEGHGSKVWTHYENT